MNLTKNFSLLELTKSQTAERKGIDNTPSIEHQENLKSLCTAILQPVRDHFGQVVSVSSGYRSPELCTAIGSKITSQHAKGEAAVVVEEGGGALLDLDLDGKGVLAEGPAHARLRRVRDREVGEDLGCLLDLGEDGP